MEIKIIKEGRKTASCSFKDGALVVKLPFWISSTEEQRVLQRFVNWAQKRIAKNPNLLLPTSLPSFQTGQRIKVSNQQFFLFIYPDRPAEYLKRKIQTSPSSHILSVKTAQKTPELLHKAVTKAIGQHFLPSVTQRVNLLNQLHFRQPISAVQLKYMKSRWGSCSNKGNISLSSRLLLAPPAVLDYVIIHELAHRIEMNHSQNFWNLVRKADPSYKEKEKWLKKNGRTCEFKPLDKSDH